MNHYTVGYYDSQHHHQDVCAYANDSFEARDGLVVVAHQVPYEKGPYTS